MYVQVWVSIHELTYLYKAFDGGRLFLMGRGIQCSADHEIRRCENKGSCFSFPLLSSEGVSKTV